MSPEAESEMIEALRSLLGRFGINCQGLSSGEIIKSLSAITPPLAEAKRSSGWYVVFSSQMTTPDGRQATATGSAMMDVHPLVWADTHNKKASGLIQPGQMGKVVVSFFSEVDPHTFEQLSNANTNNPIAG